MSDSICDCCGNTGECDCYSTLSTQFRGRINLVEERTKLEQERDQLRSRLQRANDLLRQQRSELLAAELINEDEYAALAGDVGAVERLEGYDAMRQEWDRLRRENATLAAELALYKPRQTIETGGTR